MIPPFKQHSFGFHVQWAMFCFCVSGVWGQCRESGEVRTGDKIPATSVSTCCCFLGNRGGQIIILTTSLYNAYQPLDVVRGWGISTIAGFKIKTINIKGPFVSWCFKAVKSKLEHPPQLNLFKFLMYPVYKLHVNTIPQLLKIKMGVPRLFWYLKQGLWNVHTFRTFSPWYLLTICGGTMPNIALVTKGNPFSLSLETMVKWTETLL